MPGKKQFVGIAKNKIQNPSLLPWTYLPATHFTASSRPALLPRIHRTNSLTLRSLGLFPKMQGLCRLRTGTLCNHHPTAVSLWTLRDTRILPVQGLQFMRR